MTCIVGLVEDGAVYMGGDSLGVEGWRGVLHRRPKVMRRDGMLIGAAGDRILHDVLRYAPDPFPQFVAGEDPDAYVATVFVPRMCAMLEAAGGLRRESNELSISGGVMLGLPGGHLVRIDRSGAVIHSALDYDAIGSGNDVALGSLYTSTTAPAERILIALRAAAEFDRSVRGPFEVLKLEAAG